jgi:hypothetical protein
MGDTQQKSIIHSDLTFDTPSKLRAPRAISNPSADKESVQQNVPRSKSNSSAVVSPGGRTLRKRKLESSDESIDIKEDQESSSAAVKQPSKKIAVSNVTTNNAPTTIKSTSSVRTTSALAKSKSSGNVPQNTAISAAAKKFNHGGRPGWDTKVFVIFLQ